MKRFQLQRRSMQFLIVLALLPALFIQSTRVKDSEKVAGFGFLTKICGQWNGPVYSSTPAGSFDQWFVDFRPVSANQVSQFSSMDENTLNFTSFFIVKHENQMKVAMRTEGVFKGKGCVTYEVIETADDEKGYYRFADFKKGVNRAYSEFRFNGDSLIMEVYTNKFNKVKPLQLHTRWTAVSGGKKPAEDAISHFQFPKAEICKDFSKAFSGLDESIYYTYENDPYKIEDQPYTGTFVIDIEIDEKLEVAPSDEILIMLTTESLFEGIKYKKENLKYISRSIYTTGNSKSCTVTNVHPGKYFLYAFVDKNNDKKHLSGEYMSSDLGNVISLSDQGETSAKTKIDFVIP
ncbi:MAG: hypothetical protein KKA07_04250 [Bacteroidetes bacterium]|nr:hypothetical protein [Bacteroidota bacterium]MBU1718263.1 hypothetical protein [Bacteroidota bacterium]